MIDFGKRFYVEFCGKMYKINKEKANYIFSKLENKTVKINQENLEKYLKKYDMYDDIILEGLS